MNHNPDEPQAEIFYRAVSADELIAIRQVGGLILERAELFITQDLEWVENYVRRSKAGHYDYILAIITQVGTTDWLLSVGNRHGSLAAQRRFPNHPVLKSGDRNAVHLKEQEGTVTYGLRSGTIDDFNQRIRRIEVIKAI
ncbi:hypothetical protein HYR99_20925 [Candidatus Poribacteria bacterium]|nr:hypothetical protein [Candidatus Poribacteria bacterium]